MRKAVGVEDPSEGRPDYEWGRHRPSEFQLVDTFTSAKKDSCKFEHPSGGNAQSSNRFGALGGGNGSNSQFQRDLDKYFIKLDAIETDLTTETPTWILSAYAPGRDAPDQLFGGPMREQSFEEMRLHYMKGKAEGNEQKALAEAQELYQNAQAQMQTAVRNVRHTGRAVWRVPRRQATQVDSARAAGGGQSVWIK
ncbi:hypothetical protein NLG97_g11174 [Lecanicillium saksenae]|uniref:Uncharacterized protein n=1 Tax=Lecanicillium saksenae TaxID=468837 RepID=A0ACC1QEY7_9HYPO|nr:hypothetical protein NLG97_g11174 [Lecanicillium saksenae]